MAAGAIDWRIFIRDEIDAQTYEISLHADDERLAEHLTVNEIKEAFLAASRLYSLDAEVARSADEVSVKNQDIDSRFADCIYCGGPVEARTAPREVRWQGELFVIEHVPMGICAQCGERFVKPHVAKAIDKVLRERRTTRTIAVPVLAYSGE